jgi:hypothetical protein
MLKIIAEFTDGLRYEAVSKTFNKGIDRTNILRYLKGIYSNKERFKSRFISKYVVGEITSELFYFFLNNYDLVSPFSYKEAFEIKDIQFKGLVFTSIDVHEMIEGMGKEHIKTEGIEVERKTFSKEGDYLGIETYHNIYETYRVNGMSLRLIEDIYALKVWCSTTENEHWLWIDRKFKYKPLEAVASTFRIHENVIPHIKELKRQGDIMIVEMNKDIEPEGKIVPLTAKQYFGLLTSET